MLQIPVQETSDEIASLNAKCIAGELHLAKCNVLIYLLSILNVERAPTVTHFEGEYAEWPEIDHLRVTIRGLNYLGRQIFVRAVERVGCVRVCQVYL